MSFLCLVLYTTTFLPSLFAQTLPLNIGPNGTLNVLVPNKPYFKEFVDCSDPTNIKGFCIDVFENAISILTPKPAWSNVTYHCFNINSEEKKGNHPTYDGMISTFSSQGSKYDAVVGDTTISAARLENASFTQPYLDSGIVMLAPAAGVSQHFPGVLFKPFTAGIWGVLSLSLVLTGLALWVIEHDQHPQFRRTEPKLELFRKGFWFVTSIMVFLKRESIKSPLAKCVMIAWILFILLVGSSYTASLSSILTVDELSSSMITFDEIRSKNLAVGYQVGSIVKDYLTVRQNLPESNLIPLNSTDDYSNALRNGTAAVIIDEIPYISLFLAAQSASACRFTVTAKLTIEGFGYAFGNEDLASAFSMAILNLSESGEMQKLEDGWKLSNFQCPSQIDSTRLDLDNSKGLFVLLGSATFACMAIFVLKLGIPYTRRKLCTRTERQDSIDAVEPTIMYVSMNRVLPPRHHRIRPEEFA